MQKTKKVGNNLTLIINTDKLEELSKELQKNIHAEVGIFGDVRNASIGAIHEFGSITKKIPRRSFLEVPLATQLPKYASAIASDFSNSFSNKDSKNSLDKFMEKLAIRAENIVKEAFSTGGYGSWPADKETTNPPLVKTGQLKRSITNKVVEG